MKLEHLSTFKKLFISLIFDAFGYVSFIFPFFDIVWAPLSAYFMTKLYKGNKGKIAGVIVFIEEAMPFLDIVPTFTLMWLYSYFFESEESKYIEVDS